jgi:hypothetical protein
VVRVHGIVVSTVQWRVSMELWCLQYSGVCPWNSGVYSTMVCVHGIVVSTVQWCVSTELWGLDGSDVSTE